MIICIYIYMTRIILEPFQSAKHPQNCSRAMPQVAHLRDVVIGLHDDFDSKRPIMAYQTFLVCPTFLFSFFQHVPP